MDLRELVRGCTFDDFLLTPQLGVVPRRDPAVVDLSSRFTTHHASPPSRLDRGLAGELDGNRRWSH